MHAVRLVAAVALLMQPAFGLWEIFEYPDGASCGGDEVGLLFSGNDDQTFECEGGGRYYSHDFSLKGFEAAGKKLLLYPDLGCLNGVVGEADTDGCHITPTDYPVGGFAIVNK